MEHETAAREKTAAGRLPFRLARKSKTAEGGQSLAEFALMLPFLCLLLVGIVELGRAVYITIVVNNAATAGVEFGSQNATTASKLTGTPASMQNSALCDANGSNAVGTCNTSGILTAAGITPSSGCVCDTGSGASCNPMPTNGSCANFSCTGTVVECVNVTTTASFHSLFTYPGLPQTFHANGNATMRVRK
jgi:Flp pilus assembly protein TadG